MEIIEITFNKPKPKPYLTWFDLMEEAKRKQEKELKQKNKSIFNWVLQYLPKTTMIKP